MKKIAFVIRLLQGENFHGGGEKLFSELIFRMANTGNYLIDIFCSNSDIKNIDGIRNINVLSEKYDHLKPLTMEKFYDEARKLIQIEKYDFIISENITPPLDITFLQGHSLLNRLNTKNSLEKFLYNFRKEKRERLKFQNKWLKIGYRKIFVVSNLLKQDITENFGIDESKISVIYPGVEQICTEKPDFTQKNTETTFGIAAAGFKIKGGFLFLKALGELKKRGLNFRAKIIYPKYKSNFGVKILLKLYNIEKNVEFLGFQKEMKYFYEKIDVLVAPSLEDTFNLVVLEAMSAGKPTIVSQNTGACEIIEEEKNGFSFKIDKNSPKNLADKMEFFIKNHDIFSKFAENAWKTSKNFTWDRFFDEFLMELSKL